MKNQTETTIQGFGFMMSMIANQMEQNMENEMEIAIYNRFI